MDVIPLFCALLVELKIKGDLYHIAHRLVSADPDAAVSWYAVVSQKSIAIIFRGVITF